MSDVFEKNIQTSLVWFLLICGYILGIITMIIAPELKVLIHYWSAP